MMVNEEENSIKPNATEEYHHLLDNINAGMATWPSVMPVTSNPNTQPAGIASWTNFAETFRIPFSSSTKSNRSSKGIKAFLTQITKKNCAMDMREI